MKERPIIFNGEMVKAIIENRKMQTRRIIKPQPLPRAGAPKAWHDSDYFMQLCPYGVPGDRLWVRERWAIEDCGNWVRLSKEIWCDGWPIDMIKYPATDAPPAKYKNKSPYWWNKRPSISMPRWASRITLEIVSVRVERLQDITENDAEKEGSPDDGYWDATQGVHITDYRRGFMKLWNSIYGPDAWAANPWVWVIEFKRIGEVVR